MTPERWQQIKGLLQSALERDPNERSNFLDEACIGDPLLRSEVEALIDSHDRAESFIESPAFEVMAQSLSQNDSVVGSTLGHYQILSRLGGGGMGEIYLAEDVRLGRKVALKALPAHFTKDRERVRRFQQEARAASALNHPNIITIYEIGQIGALHFIAIEFVDGETLRQRIARAELKISEALEVATGVTAALLAAHDAGIVHRDIKPENVMLRGDGGVKVLDFGLAKLTESKEIIFDASTLFQTAQGMVMGTAPYMSPEQARGLAVDPRTDIWSLGAVLYEMLSGRQPFEGPTHMDVMAAILDREPVPLVRHRGDVPTELEWIVKKALRKDRDERYQTAKELLADLRNLNQRLEFETEFGTSPNTYDSRRLDRVGYVDRQSQSIQSHTAIDSLAILPLLNDSPDHNMDYFSDGITESMINALSELSDLRVMAWSTVSKYRGRQIDPRRAGRELAVRAVLIGRLMQSGDRLVIKLELVDATDGSQLWSDSYSCDASEILVVETEISNKLSERLLLRLTSEERKQLAKRHTDNVAAYHSYLRGRYCWNKRTDEDVKKAIEYFQQAIQADPSYALAYTGLADSYLVLGGFGIATLSPREAFPKARQAAETALEIDDKLAEAHASLGYCLANYDWKWSAAEKEFQRALELKPGYAMAHHWYGFIYLAAMGRINDAIDETKQALELDPLSLPVGSNIGLLFYLARRYQVALEQFRKSLEMDRSFVYTHWEMALAYEQRAMYDEAIECFKKAIALSGTSALPKALLARTYALAGRKSEALALLEELNELSTQTYVSPYRIAAIYSALGDKDRAFQWLEHAYEGRDGWLIWLAVDPVVDSLRSDRRFAELVSRVGLTGTPEVVQSAEREAAVADQPQYSSKRWLALIAGLVLVVIGVGFALVKFWSRVKRIPGPRAVNFSQVTYQSGPEFFPALSPDGTSIAYAGRGGGNWDIYLQRVGDSKLVNLTANSPLDDSQPSFSPDGRFIAFRSEREGGGIYHMGVNGEEPVRLADFGYSPSWSPDSGKILIGTEKIPQPSTRPSRSQLWVIDVKTRQQKKLSDDDALQPTFSPNYKRIAYWSRPNRYGQREDIWTIPVAGGEPVAVTDGSTTDLNPIWSPDGKFLYFSSNRGGSFNVWRVAIDEETGATSGTPEAVTAIGANTSVLHLSFSRDGKRLVYSAQEDIRNLQRVEYNPAHQRVSSEPYSITQGSMQLWFPDPSPDGQWLTAYSMGQQRHIFVMRSDGTDLRDLTPDNSRHSWPRWSPDGQRIAFTSRRTGNYELWMMNRDGSGVRQITESSGGHYSPWSPDGNMIAYSIHTPKNDCVIVNPDKSWSDQKLIYLRPLSDASLSFEGWSWSPDGKKLAGIKHLANGVHSGIGAYDVESNSYEWYTDFGDWPLWLNDNRRLLFVSEGKLLIYNTETKTHGELLTVTDQDVDIGSPGITRDNQTIYFTFVAVEADVWLMTLE